MTRNVNIKFNKPTSVKTWSDFEDSYFFVTDGNNFLPAVLTYTYTIIVKDNIARDEKGRTKEDQDHETLTYQHYTVGPLGPYYDYARMTNGYNGEGKSTFSLAKFDEATNAIIRGGEVGPKSNIFKHYTPPNIQASETINESSGGSVRSSRISSGSTEMRVYGNRSGNIFDNDSSINGLVNQFAELSSKTFVDGKNFWNLSPSVDEWKTAIKGERSTGYGKYSSYLEGHGTSNGNVTISYTYMATIPSVSTVSSLYMFIGDRKKSAIEGDNLGLYITYQYKTLSNKRKTFSQIGNLELKPKEVANTWDPDTKKGLFKIRTITEETTPGSILETFKTWINTKYADYITNSGIAVIESSTETNVPYLKGFDTKNAKLVSQRSRLYQVPSNELNTFKDDKSEDLNLTLYYDSSYLCEVSPDVKTPEKETDDNIYGKAITYSYLFSKKVGNITLDGFPKHSYNYGYTFVPTLAWEYTYVDPDANPKKVKYVSYTGELKTIEELFPQGGEITTYSDQVKAWKAWKDKVSFRKQFYNNGVTYETSYEVSTYGLTETDTPDVFVKRYAYTSYAFSYTLSGINYTSFPILFDYLYKYRPVPSEGVENNEIPTMTYTPTFKVNYEVNKKILNLTWTYLDGTTVKEVNKVPSELKSNYFFEQAIDEPGEYVKLQFSDDAFKTTTNLKLSNKNNKVTITSHSNVFYLNIVQAAVSFNAFVPKIATSNDLNFYQTAVGGTNYGWRIAFNRKETTSSTSEIYIGVPKFNDDTETVDIEDSFGDEITTMYDVCLKIDYDISDEPEPEIKDETVKTLSELEQTHQSVDTTTIDVPSVTVDTKYFWTDDIFNASGREYRNVFEIETASGIEYFGIRSKKHDQNERNEFRFDDTKPALSTTSTGTYYLGYDLAGRIVPLTIGKNNDYIYSFKNGEQYLKVNDEWKGKELFPSKISTYEFALDREDYGPKYYVTYTSNQDQRVDVNCTDIKDLYDNTGTLLSTYSTYSISVPFVKNLTVDDNLIIKNSSYYEKTNTYTYEGLFVAVPDAHKGEILSNEFVNLYYQDISYVKLKANNIDYIKSLSVDPHCFYKYNSYFNSYQLCDLEQIKKLTNLDNIYERYVVYKEITNSKDNDKTSDKNKTPYIQKYNYTEVDKNQQPLDTVCYATKDDSNFKYTYILQGTGIVTDNSIQYYRYTYSLITNDELDKYKESEEPVFIKEKYRKVSSLDDFNTLIEKHANIYICHEAINNKGKYFELYPIGPSQILDDIDLDGNIIYVKETKVNSLRTKKSAIDVDNLKELVTKQNAIASAGITNNEEIKTRKNLTRRSILSGKTTFAADNIVDYICVFDYKNKYTEYTDIYENPWRYKLEDGTFAFIDGKLHTNGEKIIIDDKSVTSFYVYVDEPGYREISNKFISKGSKQQYYAWRIDKVQPNEIRTLNVTKFEDYIYIDATKFKLTNTFRTTGDGEKYSGIYTDPITQKTVTIAKINEFGFVENSTIHYYKRTLDLIKSEDVFMHPNKVYYRSGKTRTVKFTGSTPIINLTYTQYVESEGEGKLKFKYNTPYKVFNTGYNLLLDQVRYYNNTKVVSYLPTSYHYYAYELPQDISNEFIKTRFLYQTYTTNDNIQKSKGGAYYTNIYVFDKNNGAINKTLYLNQHIVDINAYTYKIREKHLEIVDSDVVLGNISPLNYKKYFVSTGDGQITQLNELSESPAYYYNSPGCILYTYTETENNYEYSCKSIPGSYQYYNSSSNIPIVLTVDDNTFGIISNRYDISKTPKGYSYNMFDLEIVKLYKMSKNNIGEVLQEKNVKETKIDKKTPFVLANDVEYTASGSYTWHNPVFTYHTYNISSLSYGWKQVEETAGYWTKDYEKNVIPFQTTSYIFYPDVHGISNTTLTYSFVPNSYVVSSIVEYPKISYDTIDIVTEEQIYYSYVIGGVEQHYLSTNKIQYNPDGTYTGLIRQHIFDEEKCKFMYVTKPVQLSQHKIVTKNSKITNIVNQEQKSDTTYFAYKTSIALTNESVPVLYNTELMPATTKEIRYWNTETSSYQLKTVIASYAYYAYKYMYDTIPFKVSSYLFKASYLTIDNIDDLGAYVANSLAPVTNGIVATNNVLNTLGSYYTNAEHEKLLSINKAYDVISSYVKDGFVELGQTVTTLSYSLTDTLNTSLEKVSYQSEQNTNALVDTLSAYGYTVSYTIDIVGANVLQGISEHKDKLVESLDTLSSYVKNIVLGETIEIPESMELVTYNDAVISYNMTPNTSMDSLGELLMKSFISATSETYSYIDESGYTHNIINYSYKGLGDTLSRIQVVPGIPTKQEFVMDLAPKMFANIDFDNEIVDDIKYDENGNITEKKTHKNNPTESAKKVIYRAGILWDELAKAGYCKDAAVEEKQNKLNEIKKNNLSTLSNLKIKE